MPTVSRPDRLRELLTPAGLPNLERYVPHALSAKQHAGLLLPQREVLFGGAAGGGKSDWLLEGALQYVDRPGYAALILRRTFKQLELEGGLIERASEWLAGTDAQPMDGGRKWVFPSGAVLQFGYLDGPRDHENYQGSNWHYVGFDELTQFLEKQYRYLFSRLRRGLLDGIPTRMRAASNPGGIGHDWVKQRFGIYLPDGDPDQRRMCQRPTWISEHDRAFLPAFVEDNPGLDVDDYVMNLMELDAVTGAQLRKGDWEAREPGQYFRAEWFRIVDHAPSSPTRTVRYWDLAATEPHAANTDPDWTAGLKLARDEHGWIVVDVQRFRRRPEGVEQRVKAMAMIDGRDVPVRMEEESGASGKSLTSHYARDVVPGHDLRGRRPGTDKETRARPVSSKAELGLIRLVRAPWNQPFLDELEGFPEVEHDDQVDAFSGAFNELADQHGDPETGLNVWT